MMNLEKLSYVYLLVLGLFVLGCGNEQNELMEEMEEVNKIDPNDLEEGMIVFDFQGKTLKATDGEAAREDETKFGILGVWSDETEEGFPVLNLLAIQIFAADPLDKLEYEIIWDECAANIAELPCGTLTFMRDNITYGADGDNKFFKIKFEEFGKASGEKLIGTFEASLNVPRASEEEKIEITNGAFNLVLQ